MADQKILGQKILVITLIFVWCLAAVCAIGWGIYKLMLSMYLKKNNVPRWVEMRMANFRGVWSPLAFYEWTKLDMEDPIIHDLKIKARWFSSIVLACPILSFLIVVVFYWLGFVEYVGPRF